MDRDQAMGQLPVEYARALRMIEDGSDAGAIAEALHIDLAAVGTVIVIGRSKLAAIMALDEDTNTDAAE